MAEDKKEREPFRKLENFDGFIDSLYRPNRSSAPFYSNSADYNTNSKSYYDDLSRKAKLFEILAHRIWEYDEELAKRFEEWDKLIENFPEDVKNLLIKWLQDGTLENIINHNIFNKLNDKIDTINKKLNRLFINIDEFYGSDCSKIQQALTLSNVLGGGIVYVPSRVYKLDCELIIYKNTTLLSEPGVVYERHHDGYMFLNGKRGTNYSKYNGEGNISFINGEFNGRAYDKSVGIGSNIVVAHADTVLFDNVKITNANSHHIEVNSSKNVVIRNSKFLGQPSNLQYVEAIQLDLSAETSFSGFGSYDNTPCKNVTISNNYFGASDDLPSVSRCIGTHNTKVGVLFEDINILNNEFDNARDFSIQLLCYKDSVIKDNIFRSCAGGVIIYPTDPNNPNHTIDKYNQTTESVQPSSYITVDNNKFISMNNKQIIYSYGREGSRNYEITFINNVIRDCINNSGNIMATHTTGLLIQNNKISNISTFGILLKEDTNVIVDGNFIKKTRDSTGLRATNNITNLSVTNNNFYEIGGNAINVIYDVNNILISGNIINGANGLNETYDAIYCHSSGGNFNVSNNVFNTKTNFVYESAIYITNTIDNGVRLGNTAKKGKNTETYRTANIVDNGDVVF